MKKIIKGILIVGVMGISLMMLTACNKQILDTTYDFDKAIVYMGDEKIELKIKKWRDYDGEQIQIVTKDGTVYLLSMNNTILISEH